MVGMLIDFLERTFFRRKKERGLFTSLTIDLAAILLWRGIWGLLDLYVFPNHLPTSFVFSVIVGFCILAGIKFFEKR